MKTIIFLICGIVVFQIASSQELGISASHLWTDNKELQNPNGFGVYVGKNLSNYFSLKLSYDYIYNERNYFGTLSSGMDLNPNWESIETFANAHLSKLSIVIIPYCSEYISVGGGVTVSTNYFSVVKTGLQTQLKSSWYGEQKFGSGYFFQVQLFPFQTLPFILNVNASREFMNRSTIIVTDVEMPYFQTLKVSSIQIGLSYAFK
jgi:hypothetical protein